MRTCLTLRFQTWFVWFWIAVLVCCNTGPALQAEPYSRLAYFQSRSEIRFYFNALQRGRYHFNEQSSIGNYTIYNNPATCHGPVDNST
ncbi:MAG: hypothetical protein KDC10_14960, partial [Calditrichaeota bacterium]|nr:hypothetical protein [Calditrichota bacterium]